MLSKALETGNSLHKGPVLGNIAGRSFPRAFERREKFSIIRKTFMWNLRDVFKKALETGRSLRKGPHWGTWRGFVFRDF